MGTKKMGRAAKKKQGSPTQQIRISSINEALIPIFGLLRH
jgi:hypothetical protein